MNFDFAEVLTRGWQITWKHKVLWIYGALPVLLSVFYFPLAFIFFPFNLSGAEMPERLANLVNNPAFVTVLIVGTIVVMLLSFALRVWGTAALTVGAVRAEVGEEKLGFRGLLKASLPHIPNILGAMVLVFIGVLVVTVAFSVCSLVVGFITFGIGSMFVQLLMYPLYLAIWIVLEQAQAAIVADGFGVLDAVQRGWDLLKTHIGKFALIGVVVYLATAMIGFILVLPLMLPMWLVMFRSIMLETAPDTAFLMVSTLIALAFMPVYAVFMGAAMTFTRSTFVVTYLRLTRDSEVRKALLEATA